MCYSATAFEWHKATYYFDDVRTPFPSLAAIFANHVMEELRCLFGDQKPWHILSVMSPRVIHLGTHRLPQAATQPTGSQHLDV